MNSDMDESQIKKYLNQVYSEVEKLEKVAKDSQDDILLALLSYAPMQLHRLTSGYKYKHPKAGLVFFIVVFTVIQVLAEAILKRLKKQNLVLPTLNNTHKVIVWINNYQYPEIDDLPFQEIAKKQGYYVVKPCLFSLGSITKSVFEGIRLALFYKKKANTVATWIDNKQASKFETSNTYDKSLFNALCSNQVIFKIVKTYLVYLPFLKEVSRRTGKVAVIHRNNGDISATLFQVYRKRHSLDKSKQISQILLAHVGNPVSIPNSTVGKHVDQIWVKNKSAKDIFLNREDTKTLKDIFVVGDPRQEIFSRKREQRSKKGGLIVALTEKPKERLFQGQSAHALSLLQDTIKHLGNKYSIEIKRRSPVDLKERISALISNSSLKPLLKYVGSRELPDSAVWADIALIFGNERMKLVSSVAFDYLQAGVPTVVVLPGINNLEEITNWKKVSNVLWPILYTENSFRECLEKNNLKSLEENALNFINKYLSEDLEGRDAQNNFDNLLDNI